MEHTVPHGPVNVRMSDPCVIGGDTRYHAGFLYGKALGVPWIVIAPPFRKPSSKVLIDT